MVYLTWVGLDSTKEIWYWYLVVHEETIVSTSLYAIVLKLISFIFNIL